MTNKRSLNPVERDLIIAALEHQRSSFVRSFNANARSPDLATIYESRANECTHLIADIQSLELF